jgi:arginyl-tRNA synthetase
MGTVHDYFIPESICAKTGQPIVEANIGNIFEESKGAIIFQGEKRGLHTRVFISGEGIATYETKDIGLLAEKFARFSPDNLLLVTDIEQKEYYRVVLEAAGEINPEWKEKTTHVVHGRLRFPEGRLSSRLGNVLLLEDILEETTAPLMERGLSKEDAHIVAVAAIKYTILKSELGGTIIFDREKALSFEGDSGPYLQYTYARCRSLLRKTAEAGIEVDYVRPNGLPALDVERLISRFPKTASKAAAEFAPHQIATYAIELARAYNSWYAANNLLKQEDKVIASYGAALTLAVSLTIKKSLWILGIETIEQM